MNVKEYNSCVDLYSDAVYRFILKNIGDTEKSHDIVQDSYAKLWETYQNVNYKKAKSYLFSTAYHRMIDIIRKEKRMVLNHDLIIYNQSDEAQYSDLQEILHIAIKKLPDTQRAVVMLRDYEGYSYDEIAEITKLSESQVKVYIYRARKFLKNYIGKIEYVI